MRDVRDGAVVGDVDVESSGTSMSALRQFAPVRSYFAGRGVRAAWTYLSGLWSMVITSPSFTTRVSLGRADFAKVWCVPGLVSSTGSRLAKAGLRSQKGGMYM